MKVYIEQVYRNVGPSSWLDAHLVDGSDPPEVEPGTLNVFDQKRIPNSPVTAEEALQLKRHKPNKGRRVMSETVTNTSSVNSAHNNNSGDGILRQSVR